MVMKKVVCPVCGKVNELAEAEGYTEEYPREWHSACAAVVEALRSHGAAFDGGSDQSRLELARDWMDADFDGADVYDWCEVGCWDADTARQFAAEGLTPAEVKEAAEKLVKQNGTDAYTDGCPVYSVCNGDTPVKAIVDGAE
jgi:hypothetical protein